VELAPAWASTHTSIIVGWTEYAARGAKACNDATFEAHRDETDAANGGGAGRRTSPGSPSIWRAGVGGFHTGDAIVVDGGYSIF